MRDPERIPRMLALLERIWRANPDMRLGQIIERATVKAGDTFWADDEETEAGLRWLIEISDKESTTRSPNRGTGDEAQGHESAREAR